MSKVTAAEVSGSSSGLKKLTTFRVNGALNQKTGSATGSHRFGSKNSQSANVSASQLPPYRISSAAGGPDHYQVSGGDVTHSMNYNEDEDNKVVDFLGAVNGEGYGHNQKGLNFKDRFEEAGNAKGKRNLDIVDTIYDKTEKRTLHQINKLKFIDDLGLQHRLREKTICEENLEKIEHNVTEQFLKDQNFAKVNNVTDVTNKAFVTEEAKLNQEKLKGKFDLIINHDLKMSKKIEMYGNDNLVYHLHKGRNFIYKLKKGEEQRIKEKLENEQAEKIRANLEEKKKQYQYEQELLRKQQEVYQEQMVKDLKELGQVPEESQPAAFIIEQAKNTSAKGRNKKLAHIQPKLFDVPKTFVQSTKHQDQIKDHYRYNMITNKILSSSLENRHYNKSGFPLSITSSKNQKYLTTGIQSPQNQRPAQPIISNLQSNDTPRNLNNDIHIQDNRSSFGNLKLPLVLSETKSSLEQFGALRVPKVNGFGISNPHHFSMTRTYFNKGFFQHNKVAAKTIEEIEKNSIKKQPAVINSMNTTQQIEPQQKQTLTSQVKRQIRGLAEICNRSNRQTIQSLQNFEIEIEDERLKEKNFSDVFNLLREVDGGDGGIVESMFKYKIDNRLEYEEEARFITKQYKMGAFDPSKDISKFEQKQRFKKRKEMLRKQAQQID